MPEASPDHPRVDPPRIGELEYHGVQRLPWEEIETDFYTSRSLPDNMTLLWQRIDDQSRDAPFLPLCFSVSDAMAALRYSNRDRIKNELIALQADWLNGVKPAIGLVADNTESLGYDIITVGTWSLLADGVFRQPTHFRNWIPHLNVYGLFSDLLSWRLYVDFYVQAAKDEIVEPPLDNIPILPIRVARYHANEGGQI